MTKDEMAYYDLTSPEVIAAWEDYRQRFVAFNEAAGDLAKEIGATRFWLGFQGSIVKAEFPSKDARHPAFSNKFERRGGHALIARGKTDAQREAVAFMEKRNKALCDMNPNPNEIAKGHGFIFSISYKDANAEGFNGHRVIGSFFHRVQPLWAGISSPITLYAPAPDIAIANEAASGRETDPAEWHVPAGYKRILKEEWDMRLATYKLERAKAGQPEGDDDE